MTHGTRPSYRAGCRCTPCRAANAAAVARWRIAKKADRPLLGARVSGVEARRLVRLILLERYRKMALARALGQSSHLARLLQSDMIALRTFLKIRRFYRQHVLDSEACTRAGDHDAPDPV